MGLEGSRQFSVVFVKKGGEMDIERLKSKILDTQEDGKIPCKKALEIAEEENVPPLKVGEILNELKIKIVSCQLGCFK